MFDDLAAFVAAVEEGSLTQAASRLCLTQSAVSRRIQQLEERLGATLLERSSRPLVPNRLGSRVYEKALLALKAVDAVAALSRADTEPSGVFRLGVTHALGELLVVKSVEAIKDKFAMLEVRLRSEWSAGLRDGIARSELDAAFILLPLTETPRSSSEGVQLATLDMAIVQSRRNPIVTGRVSMSALAEKQWILNPQGCGYRAALQGAIGSGNLRVLVDVFGTEMQLGMVASGLGLGVVPRKVLGDLGKRREIAAVDVADFSMKLNLWLIHGAELGNLAAVITSLSGAAKAAMRIERKRGGIA